MQTSTDEKIVILGISDQPERYSNMAFLKLTGAGYKNLIGVSPKKPQIDGLEVCETLSEIDGALHTLTIYVGKERLTSMLDEIFKLKPKRIILNPGTENEKLIEEAKKYNIEVVCGCTLVMLSTDQF